MTTRACPSCSEIIPADVDYCPYCGNTTRETLDVDEDGIAAANAAERGVKPLDDGSGKPKLPVEAISSLCMMCYMAPATIGDYCDECDKKLNLRADEWDAIGAQKAMVQWIAIGIAAFILLIIIGVALTHHHRHVRHHLSPQTPTVVPTPTTSAQPASGSPTAVPAATAPAAAAPSASTASSGADDTL
jgi:hypothetical protein